MAKCYINTTFGYLEQIIYERDFTKNPEVEHWPMDFDNIPGY